MILLHLLIAMVFFSQNLRAEKYIGLKVGVVDYLKKSNEFLSVDAPSRGKKGKESNLSKNHLNKLLIGSLIGLRHKFDKHVVGIECDINLQNQLLNHKNLFSLDNDESTLRNIFNFFHDTKVSIKYKISPLLTYGYSLKDNVVVFVKNGMSYARLNIDRATRIRGFTTGRVVGLDKKENRGRNVWGFKTIVGLEHSISKKLSVTYDIGYEIFKSVKLNLQDL